MTGFQKQLVFCLGLALVAGRAQADSTATVRGESASGISDVTMTANADIAGRFIDGEGRPVDGAIVTLSQERNVVARTTTDKSGAYQFHQMRQGVYELTVGTQTQPIRVWNPTLAPPASRSLVTTVRADRIVRGQLGLIGGTVGSTVGAVGGVAGVAAGGYSITQSMDAQDEADAAKAETAQLSEMMKMLMSP